jgi:serine/threonine protein kinase
MEHRISSGFAGLTLDSSVADSEAGEDFEGPSPSSKAGRVQGWLPAVSCTHDSATSPKLSDFTLAEPEAVISPVASTPSLARSSVSTVATNVYSRDINFGIPPSGDWSDDAIFAYGESRRKAYKDIGLLGSGSQAIIKLVRSLEDGLTFAMKVINKPSDPAVKRRAEAHTRYRWEVLLALIGNDSHIPLYKEGFETRSKFFGILEMMESDLERYLKEHGTLTEDVAATVTVKLLDTLARLHAGGVMHRDVKPSNTLLRKANDPTSIALGDFTSVFLPPVLEGHPTTATGVPPLSVANLSNTIAGTPYYLAPEICNGNSYSAKVDIWSTGVLV